MKTLTRAKLSGAVIFLQLTLAIGARAQMFTTLVSFKGSDGVAPEFVSLVQGADGDYYGTTQQTVFKVTPQGTLTTLYSFCSLYQCADGSFAEAGLVLAIDGNFYGTTSMGGVNCPPYGCGTVFKVTPKGALTTLYSFCPQDCSDGYKPMAALVQATNRSFYGTTQMGGAGDGGCGGGGCGTIFRITSGGEFAALYSFNEPDGNPIAGLIQGSDGNLYGANGGTSDDGSIFKITSAGTYSTLNYFNFTDGAFPYGKLVEGRDGKFYGTTWGGGANGNYGAVFSITRAGAIKTLYSFCAQPNCQDGAFPWDGLVLGTDGNLYGTTSAGGTDFVDCNTFGAGCGTVFRITSAGVLTTLHNFDLSDGATPYGGLVQSTTGLFYGTTSGGGASGDGTVFSLNVGLAPFVTFVQAAGKVGQTGGILGQGFTGTSSVMLNGIPASFTVVSDTFIEATVPPSATTGYVTVTTPSGVLKSNVPFRVIQ